MPTKLNGTIRNLILLAILTCFILTLKYLFGVELKGTFMDAIIGTVSFLGLVELLRVYIRSEDSK